MSAFWSDPFFSPESIAAERAEEARRLREGSPLVMVYCEHCNKTHAVERGEEECSPGAWRFEGERWPTDSMPAIGSES